VDGRLISPEDLPHTLRTPKKQKSLGLLRLALATMDIANVL